MDGEFNGLCSRYYNLTQLLTAQDERFKRLLDNALPYTGQTNLADLDAIISCNRRVQEAKANVEQTLENMRQTERSILFLMNYFEIPPGTVLAGKIDGELEFEIWADENDTLYINKTKDLASPVDETNIITIRLRRSRDEVVEDED
jgi:hypothetical protein